MMLIRIQNEYELMMLIRVTFLSLFSARYKTFTVT